MTRGSEEADGVDGMRSSMLDRLSRRWLWLQCELPGRRDYGYGERKSINWLSLVLSSLLYRVLAIYLSFEYSLQREAVVAVIIQKVLD